MRASDFPFSVRRARALGSAARRLFAGIRSIRADDRSGRIEVTLRRGDATFRYALASTLGALIPRGTPLRPAKPPPGVGPYRISSAGRGGFLMRRVRGFRVDGLPAGHVDRIIARAYADRERAFRDVVAGRVDYTALRPPVGALPDARSKYRDRFVERPLLRTRFVYFAADHRPFDQPHVRQAVAYALDEAKMARLANGFLQPTCNLLPPALAGGAAVTCPWGDPAGTPDVFRGSSLLARSGARRTRVRVQTRGAPPALARYYLDALRSIGLRARVARGGRRADTGFGIAAGSPPDAGVLVGALLRREPVARSARVTDPVLVLEGRDARRTRDRAHAAGSASRAAAALVRRALVLPFGAEKGSAFFSERLDAENCAVFHPVFGEDLSSFCLR